MTPLTPPAPPEFTSLSNFLLGIPWQPPLPPIATLDPQLVNIYYGRLTSSMSDPPILSQMAPLLNAWSAITAQPREEWPTLFNAQILNNPTLWPPAQQIVLAWYTGVCGSNLPRTPDLYERTLVWLLAQAHPMGVPLGFGYWQYPPPGANQ